MAAATGPSILSHTLAILDLIPGLGSSAKLRDSCEDSSELTAIMDIM